MFIDAMGLILGDNKKITLGELSKPRALSAIPFGGRYRIIDYMLSNMVNSGIKNIGIHTYTKYKSLMDHLGTGSSWDLDRKNSGGLHILPPYVNSEATSVQGDEEMAGLLDFVRSSNASYVIMAASNVILNTTFTEFVEDFKACGADISVMYNRDGTKFGGPNYKRYALQSGEKFFYQEQHGYHLHEKRTSHRPHRRDDGKRNQSCRYPFLR